MNRMTSAFVMLTVGAVCSAQPFERLPAWDVPAGPSAAEHITVAAVPSHGVVRPGQTFHLAAYIRIADGWVYYSPDPGERVLPAGILVAAGPLTVGEILWPPHHVHEVLVGDVTLANNVYEGRAVAYVPLTVPKDLAAGDYQVTLSLKGQICKDVCLNLRAGDVAATAAVRVGAEPQANPAWEADGGFAAGLERAALVPATEPVGVRDAAVSGAAGELTIASGLGLALLAGLILNIMPCVLPVIPLRILSIVEMAKGSRRRYVTMGLAFAGGIVLFFAGVAAANAILKLSVGRALDWSEHYRIPGVRIALAMVLVALAANLFGLFNVTVPSRIAGAGGTSGSNRQGHVASMGMGLMMAILATPCSFAILALTLAWAQGQALPVATAAFVLLGVGMAAPHAVLCALPQLVSLLPRPGRWMELFKQSMGFLVLLAAVYLISTLGKDAYPAWVAGFGVVLAVGLWMWGSWVRYDAPLRRKLLVRGLAAALVAAAGWWMLPPPRPLAVAFAPLNPQRLEAARKQGRVVLVKFTAAWCTSCKQVDAQVYGNQTVAKALAERDVLAMIADVTDRDTPDTAFLQQRFNRPIPLTVVFPPAGRPPILLEGLFTSRDLIKALDAASQRG